MWFHWSVTVQCSFLVQCVCCDLKPTVVVVILMSSSTSSRMVDECRDRLQAQSVIVVVVIAQRVISYHQLSRLRKSATAARLSHSKLRRMALTVKQMLYGVWCHSTLQTDIWYATELGHHIMDNIIIQAYVWTSGEQFKHKVTFWIWIRLGTCIFQ